MAMTELRANACVSRRSNLHERAAKKTAVKSMKELESERVGRDVSNLENLDRRRREGR